FFLVENNICPSRFFSSKICITVLIAGINVTYGLLLVKSVNIEEWLKDIKRDWNHIKDIEEFKILQTHVAMGNRYANISLSKKLKVIVAQGGEKTCIIVSLCTFYAGFTIIMTLSLSHRILEILLSANKTLCYVPYVPIMLLEESRNYYLIATLKNVINFLIPTIFGCRDILFLLTTLHTHGLYKIAINRQIPIQFYCAYDIFSIDLQNDIPWTSISCDCKLCYVCKCCNAL
ncbi:unnamed protein product, partial [Heterotrigona itama]